MCFESSNIERVINKQFIFRTIESLEIVIFAVYIGQKEPDIYSVQFQEHKNESNPQGQGSEIGRPALDK